MLYVCNCCGRKFEEDEVRTVSENVGEFWGAPAYMDYDVCPQCGSDDFDEVAEDEDSEDLENDEED